MKNLDFHTQLSAAYTLVQNNEFKKAKIALEAILKMKDLSDVDRSNTLRRLASCESELGNTKAALKLLEKAKSLINEHSNEMAWLLDTQASIHLADDQYPEALRCYREAIVFIQETYNLEYFEDQITRVMEQFESYKIHGSFKDWKKRLLKDIAKKLRIVEKEMQKSDSP